MRASILDNVNAIRLGSRGSALARYQVETVGRLLGEVGLETAVEWIRTTGDAIQDRPLAEVGGKGLFIKEIEAALLERRIDCAVHSLKDVPAEIAPGCRLAAVLPREDARDVLVAHPGMRLLTLPAGARVGTGSLRRQAQARAVRPDLEVVALRGNVDSRLERWRRGDFDALLLAAAGLKRLGRTEAIAEWIAPELLCPPAGQGAIAIECRGDNPALQTILGMLNHAPTEAAVTAERAVIRALGCGCQSPVGAHAWFEASELRLRAVVASADGSALIRAEAGAAGRDPEGLGKAVAQALRAQGAEAILAEVAGA